MKFFTKVFLLALMPAALTFSSCKKEEEPGGGGGNNNTTYKNLINAKVDGTQFNLDSNNVVVSYESASKLLTITGKAKSQVAINLGLIFRLDMGNTLDLADPGQASGQYQDNSMTSDQVFISESGTLTITKNDANARIVEGTFSFVAKNTASTPKSVTVSEGKFGVKY